MTSKYYAILTNQGAARLANATALGTKLNLTQMAVGDANGVLPNPDPAQTKLINQKRIAPLNLLSVDPNNTSQIIAEQIIPENEGGFWIREIGLYDDDGILIAVANCPETYKPQLQEGSGRTQTIRMILIVSSTSAITLKIDPSVVLATRQYVDDKVIEVKAYTDSVMKAHADAANPHKQYPLIANALKEMADADLVSQVLVNLGLGDGSGRLVGIKRITTSGTYTPTPGTKSIIVELLGGGGGGGGVSANDSASVSGGQGGAAGSYGKARLTSGFGSVTVTIGAAGAPGVAGVSGNGGDGGNTSFGSLVTVTGGVGGKAGNSVTLVAIGQSTTNNTGTIIGANIASVIGQDGESAVLARSANITGGMSGCGGTSMYGKAGGRVSTQGAGLSAEGFGSGGSGGIAYNSGSAQVGGAGTPGVIIVWEYA
ncbi:phage tail protein [Scandinavium hiltneri]|uniref:phage tail protein n=1 Tax=Scandinavium hiltneri TaxID=2926519 RepID=UPI002869EB4E|nr:phage tail protein [Scandinavium hiltneri]